MAPRRTARLCPPYCGGIAAPGKRTGSRGLVRSRARRLVPLILEMPERMGFPAAFSAAAAVWTGALVFCLDAFGLVAW